MIFVIKNSKKRKIKNSYKNYKNKIPVTLFIIFKKFTKKYKYPYYKLYQSFKIFG